ncbi:reverse transcriptase domain-containing protein [Tanacetum coccineum]
MSFMSGTSFGFHPFQFSYPERKLIMEEMVYKFIEEGKWEHKEMGAFIREFRTTNELLLKERNNSLSELRFEGLLSNITRLEEACIVTMNERCSTVLLNKLPLKEKHPGSFTIPCDIGHLHINNALADLGASISLMPYMIYEKFGLGEPKPTRMSLELADRFIQYPRGIIENVLIKIDKFIFPIDFVILDMREESRILIILGRLFLATARAMIDVFNKNTTLRVGDEEVLEKQKGAENLVADHLSRLKNRNVGELTKKEITDESPDEHLMILKAKLNEDEPWGHHIASITRRKVYESGFFWPGIFKDAKYYIMKCDACQKSGKISSQSEMPQNNIQVCDVIDVWGLYFMGICLITPLE